MRYQVVLFYLFPCILFAQPKGPYCGNGIVEPPEECDNSHPEAGCSEQCFIESVLYEFRGDKPPKNKPLDPQVAFRRSLVVSVFVPGGLYLGPSLGHIYAGEGSRALLSLLFRSAVLAGEAVVLREFLEGDLDRRAFPIAMSVGGALVLGSAVIDLLDSADAVERTNKKKAILASRKPPASLPSSSPP